MHERLHLLVRTLDDLPARSAAADLRRGHHADRAAVLGGRRAPRSPPFWRLDGPGLDDALAATPSARFRVAADAGAAIGRSSATPSPAGPGRAATSSGSPCTPTTSGPGSAAPSSSTGCAGCGGGAPRRCW